VWLICLLGVALWAAGALSVCAHDGHGAAEQWGLAEQLFKGGEYYRAVTEYKRFLFYFPQSPEGQAARLRIIQAYVAGRWSAEGLKAAKDLLEPGLDGELGARVRFLQAVCQMRLGQLAEARSSLQDVIRLSQDPEMRGRAQYLLGEAHAIEEAWEDAARLLESIEPQSALRGRGAQNAQWIRSRAPLAEKSPWTAGLLAAILPGAGHLYTGRTRDAALVLAVNGAFVAATVEAIQKENHALAGGLAMAELLWYSGNIFSAVGSAHKYNRTLRTQLLEEIHLPAEWVEQLPPLEGWGWRKVP
jgi:tetratricopeptide (TPR) repeat protein